MNAEEAYQRIAAEHPQLVYVAGKTSTGKSTFANKVRDTLGYALVELDDIFLRSVLPAFPQLRRDLAFLEVYKNRSHMALVNALVTAARQQIDEYLAAGKRVVIEGALANAETLHELIGSYENTVLYFHPENLDRYVGYLCQRMQSEFDVAQHASGKLPNTFWKIMGPTLQAEFEATRHITPAMQAAVRRYAESSKDSSVQRIDALRAYFPHLEVVSI